MAGRIAAGRGLAITYKMQVQQPTKTFCNFMQKRLAKNTSRNALRTDIKNWFSNKSKLQPKFCWQGSFAMKTVINTIGDNEYDLDDGVYIQGYDDVELEDWPVASTVHKWVKDAVSERTKKDPADKKTCIRVTYADGYHIDLPIYIVKDDTAFLAHLSGGAWHH